MLFTGCRGIAGGREGGAEALRLAGGEGGRAAGGCVWVPRLEEDRVGGVIVL